MRSSPIRVGIIGCGEVSQVVHLPTLSLLPHLFKVTAICDPSQEAISHIQSKFNIPKAFLKSSELVSQPDVDLVLICSPDEFHLENVIEACEAEKHVLVEKPMVLTNSGVKQIIEARDRNGVTVSVGYMRRFSEAFAIFKRLIREKESGEIKHVIVKDVVGPNSFFVNQSGTYPQKFISDIPSSLSSTNQANGYSMASEFLGEEKAKSQRLVAIYRLLGSLGSHDLSLMRETLGKIPDKCIGAFANEDGQFINATFVVDKEGEQGPFGVQYMTGIHEVGFFDASIEIICQNRVIKIQYDTPYIKALPVKITVRENFSTGEFSEREIRSTFKDPYTSEWEALHAALKIGKGLKTTVEDAAEDLEVFGMILEKIV